MECWEVYEKMNWVSATRHL